MAERDGTVIARLPRPARPATRVGLSACIICYQEADRITECIESVAFCDEVVVIDSGSTDGTREAARAAGARVVLHTPFAGMNEQRQVSIDAANHDWVLCLDADERITPALRARILELQRTGFDADGYEFPRLNHYLGKVMRRGVMWPDRKLRLLDRRRARCRGTNPHDRIVLDDGTRPARIDAPIEHLSYRNFAEHVRKVDSYTATAARALLRKGRRSHWYDLAFRPSAVFIKSLVIKRGFLDGWRGFVIAAMACYMDWLKYWRLRRVQREEPRIAAGRSLPE